MAKKRKAKLKAASEKLKKSLGKGLKRRIKGKK
jgi:hypothetical protein